MHGLTELKGWNHNFTIIKKATSSNLDMIEQKSS